MSATTRRRFLGRAAACAGALWMGAGRARSGTAGEDEAAFLAAVRAGELERVRALLAGSPALAAAREGSGRSALVLAFLGGHEEVAKALLAAEPPLELAEAAMIPDWGLAARLAAAEPAALEAWHPVGGTPLYAAARMARPQMYALQSLGAGADGNPRGAEGVTPAYGALEHPDPVGAWVAAVDLLSNGADVNAPQRGGDSLLHVAARRGDPRLVRYLLRRGARVEARDARGATPLEHAGRAGHAACAALLRDHAAVPRDEPRLREAYDAGGAPVEWPDLSDLALADHEAVTSPSHFDLERVRELCDGDPRRSFSRSSQGELAVEACAHTGRREIARYHLDHGAPQSVATSLSVGDLARAAEMLDEHPASLHERGPHDFPLMWYASIGGGDVAAAELLLARGAEVDQESLGLTALHQAAQRGQRDLAAFLIERGARLDAVGYKFDRAGQTPLALARVRGQEALARLLEERGAR